MRGSKREREGTKRIVQGCQMLSMGYAKITTIVKKEERKGETVDVGWSDRQTYRLEYLSMTHTGGKEEARQFDLLLVLILRAFTQ